MTIKQPAPSQLGPLNVKERKIVISPHGSFVRSTIPKACPELLLLDPWKYEQIPTSRNTIFEIKIEMLNAAYSKIEPLGKLTIIYEG